MRYSIRGIIPHTRATSLIPLAIAALIAAAIGSAALAAPDPARRTDAADNQGVVELEVGGSAGVSVRIAEELAQIFDDGATRRLLPVVGKGSLQTLVDLMLLRGVDMAIVQTDVLEYARQNKLFPGIEVGVTYVTKLHNEEFHLLVGADVKSVADLARKKVNVDGRGSGTAVTAGAVFDLLKVPVQITNDPPELALTKLRRGEIAALALVAAKPAPLFERLKPGDGLHFLAIPLEPTISTYVPTSLSTNDYPALVAQGQPVDTLAVGTVLVVAGLQPQSPRYRNVANLVEVFFTAFQSLLEPGRLPLWQDVNIAAELPGWRRFPPADQWLRRNAAVAGRPSPQDLKSAFSSFIDKRQELIGGPTMTQDQKDELFQRFELWQSGHTQ